MKIHVFCTYKTFLFLFYSFMLIVMTTCQKNWKVWTLFLKWKLKSWKIFEQKIWNLNERYYCYLLCYFCVILKYSHILVYGIMLSIVYKVYFCSLLTFYPKKQGKNWQETLGFKIKFYKINFLSFFSAWSTSRTREEERCACSKKSSNDWNVETQIPQRKVS